MKGVSVILMAVLMVALSTITAMGIYFSATASNVESTRRSIIERGIVAEINEVEFLKQNLHQALDYSFYQSKYEVAGLGGYIKLADAPITYNNLPYWRVYTTPYMPNYIKYLEDRTLELYNIYNNSIKTEISKSGASEATVERKITPGIDYAIVTAFSTKPIKLEKPNLTIEESGTINETIRTKIFNQFDIGKNNFVDKDSILQITLDAINDANFADSGSLTYHCTPARNPTPEEVFINANGMTFAEAEELIRNSIKNKIADLESNLNTIYGSTLDTHLIFTEDDVKSKIESSCTYSSGDSDCCRKCCTPTGCVCCGIWYRTDCNFYYYGAARVFVNITDKTKTYAVYDYKIGNTDLRNIQLKFYAVSGNKELITP